MVVECSCGMVMSSADDDSRRFCIRCGRADFQVIDSVSYKQPTIWQAAGPNAEGDSARPLALAGATFALTASIVDGSDI